MIIVSYFVIVTTFFYIIRLFFFFMNYKFMMKYFQKNYIKNQKIKYIFSCKFMYWQKK